MAIEFVLLLVAGIFWNVERTYADILIVVGVITAIVDMAIFVLINLASHT